MKKNPNEWQRLVAAARHTPETEAGEVPYGFSTRVAAQACEPSRPDSVTLFLRVSLRALALAVIVTAGTVALNLKPVLTTLEDEVAALSEPIDFEETSL